MASIHTGTVYSSCGSIVLLYIVFSPSCLSLQLILADLDNVFMQLGASVSYVFYGFGKFKFTVYYYN